MHCDGSLEMLVGSAALTAASYCQLQCRIFPQTAVAITKVKQHGTEFCGHDLKVLERSKSTEICAEFVAGFMANIGGYPSLVHPQEREK